MIQAGGDVITGGVFVGRFARMRDVWLDPAPVFDEVGVDGFVGRSWLVAELDRFLRRHDRGHVVLEAAAGLGKSTLAAWLARERGWPCHFTRRRKGRATATALRNLAAQLIARFGLDDEFAPGGVVPDTAGEPGWFDQVLRAAASRTAEPLVIVVDGLDEAEQADGDLPLGLPSILPTGVFFVVTCRTGTDLSALRQPRLLLRIDASDQRNTDDLRHFVTTSVRAEPHARILTEHGLSPEVVADTLVPRCGGVWVYARYVLDEIRYGLRNPAELDSLPADLAHYYLESLSPLRRAPTWTTTSLPLLGTLAACAEPLAATTLAHLAGVADKAAVHRLCLGLLRPFLVTVHDERDGDRYGIYHDSLREFLSGTPEGQSVDGVRAALAEFLTSSREAHHRIVDVYLERFGGLAGGLPRLASKPELAAGDGGYPLRHLTHHLERSGRIDDLHRLLACEYPVGPRNARNTWFHAHERFSTVEDYLTDLERARRHAESATNAAVVRGRAAASMKLELRYALIRAAVVSLTSNIPAALLPRLIGSGDWTPQRALAYARQVHSPFDRARALTALVEHLPDPLAAGVAAEALAAARFIADGATRARTIRDLADHLTDPRSAREEAFTAVRDVLDEDDLADVLIDLADDLPDGLTAEAWSMASRISHEPRRADVYEALVPRLPDSLVPEICAAARTTARSTLLAAVADRLPSGLVDDAVALADGIPDIVDRLHVMRRLAVATGATSALRAAQRVEEEGLAATDHLDRAAVLVETGSPGRAVDAARLVEDPADRANALAAIAARLEPAAQGVVITEALSAAALLHDEDERAEVLVTVASTGPEAATATILRLARRITEPATRATVLAAVAARDPAVPGLVGEVLDAVEAVDPEWRRAEVLAEVSPLLGQEYLVRALLLCQGFMLGHHRTAALDALAPILPDRLVGEALATSQIIDDQRSHVHLIARVAAHHTGSRRAALTERAITVAEGITAERWRTAAFIGLGLHTDGDLRHRMMSRALSTARDIPEPPSRAGALIELSRHAPEHERPSILAEARIAIDELPEPAFRAWHLARLAPHLPKAERVRTLELAVTTSHSAATPAVRAAVLATLASQLEPPRSTEVLAEAMAIIGRLDTGTGGVARALGTMLRLVPHRLTADLLRALGAALITSASPWRMDQPTSGELAELREHVGKIPARMLHAAIDATSALPDAYTITQMWGAVALHLSGPLRERVLEEVLNNSRSTRRSRATFLLHAAVQWRGEVGVDEVALARRMVGGLDFGDCQYVLANVPDAIYDLGGQDVLADVLTTVDTIRRWWAPPGPDS